MNEYERGKLQGFTLGLAWFTAEELELIAHRIKVVHPRSCWIRSSG